MSHNETVSTNWNLRINLHLQLRNCHGASGNHLFVQRSPLTSICPLVTNMKSWPQGNSLTLFGFL